jgi:hypothetical protein
LTSFYAFSDPRPQEFDGHVVHSNTHFNTFTDFVKPDPNRVLPLRKKNHASKKKCASKKIVETVRSCGHIMYVPLEVVTDDGEYGGGGGVGGVMVDRCW